MIAWLRMTRSMVRRCLAVMLAMSWASQPIVVAAASAPLPSSAAPSEPTANAAGQGTLRTVVAVMPLQVAGEMSPADRALLTDELLEGLRRGKFQVVPAEEVLTQSPDASNCRRPKCFVGVAKATGASHLVRAKVTVQDRDYEVAVELLDGATGEVIVSGREGCEICGLADTGNLMTSAAATLRTKLDALSKGPPTLRINSQPRDAIVTIDGDIVGTTPVERPTSAGKHLVRVSKEGYIAIEREVTFVEGGREALDFELEKLPSRLPSRPWGWASLSVGMAALGGGVALVAVHDLPYEVGDGCDMPDNRDAAGECRWLWNTKWYGAAAAIAGAALVTLGVAILVNTARKDRPKRGAASKRARVRVGVDGAVLGF